LKPCVKKDYECLLLIQLPFSEDVRSYYFPSFDSKDKTKLTAEQLEAVDHLITSMDLMDSPHNEQGSREENFKPKLMYNPLLQRLYQCIRHRSMYPDQLLPDLDPLIASYLQPPTDVATQSVGPLQRINVSMFVCSIYLLGLCMLCLSGSVSTCGGQWESQGKENCCRCVERKWTRRVE
jgi:ATP-dependent DNA helicase 2 subunit 2